MMDSDAMENSHHLRQFVAACRRIGKSQVLAQAGGGNISLKMDKSRMIIKSSGYDLAEVTGKKGHCVVLYPPIASFVCREARKAFSLRWESQYNLQLEKSTLAKDVRPSLETGFHAVLGRAVVHTHPLFVNAILCSKGGKALVKRIAGRERFLWVPYQTPGVELSAAIAEKWKGERLLFLENHGMVVNGGSMEWCVRKTEKVLEGARALTHGEKDPRRLLNWEKQKGKVFKSPLVKEFLKTNAGREKGMENGFLFPDAVVYCHSGFSFGTLDKRKISLLDDGSVYLPKAASAAPSRVMETVLMHLAILLLIRRSGAPKFLTKSHANIIMRMESEKYRQRQS